ncbi:MAG: hypothetical protein M0P16_00290 [Syntrophales bacterium]|jgi:hypothetical protein|nr:hypothetical protein [Syntrophales bacterium]
MKYFRFFFQIPGKGTWVRTFLAMESEVHELASVLSRITRMSCIKIDNVDV